MINKTLCSKDEIWEKFVQPLLNTCATCTYALYGGALADADDCGRDDYDGSDPACVDDWWDERGICAKWELAPCLEEFQEPEEPDKSKYVSLRETNCMKCKKPGRCEVTFEYTQNGKMKGANVTKLEDGWAYQPFGDAGGEAPYCMECTPKICWRCGGSGTIMQTEDAHRSAGIIPCPECSYGE